MFFRFCHASLDSGTRYLRFQVSEDISHLQECRRLVSRFSIPAIDLNAADDEQPQVHTLDSA